MRRLPTLAGLLLLAPLSLPLLAQSDAPARRTLDANGDGAIDRTEAAAMPRLAERFDQLDRDKDGRLTAAERPRHHGPGGKRGGRGGHGGGIERADADKDGRISRAEFATLEAKMAERRTRHARRAQEAGKALPSRMHPPMDFAALDANRDGYLVRTELHAFHERMRPQREAARKARFDEAFAKADLNRDGRLSRIEVGQAMPRVADRFAWMDDNRDGFLSRAELQPPHVRR